MSRPNAIQKLSPQLIGKIAAGEVVERPASVVKELLENALDAGARQVTIEIGRGGLDLMRISDDGCGIAPDDLPLAFQRHATSKLFSDEGLDAISTLGFRGEALPSIAAVADVEMLSRPADAAAGRFVAVRDGQIAESGDRGTPPGTIVTVRHLFTRQPARLKFLRSPAAEAAQIASVVSHYALAYPEVRFTLLTDGRLTLRTSGSGDPLDAAAGVYGHQVARSLLPLAASASSRSVLPAFEGLIGEPELSRANRNYITLFINRRWVRNRALTFAVEEAYQGFLMTGRHPLAVVDVRLAAADVDVNVHPSKLEVRLRNEREVFALLQREVRRTLTQRSPLPSVAATTWSGGPRPALPDRPAQTPPLPLEHAAIVLPSERQPLVPSLPALRPLGQVGSVYIAAEGPEGLYLVDQHAAHERILFERFLKAGAAPDAQGLLEPVAVELAPRQQALVEEMAQELVDQGFALEPFGERSFLVRSVPAALAAADVAASLVEFLDALAREEAVPDRRQRVAMSLACHAAIRAGQTLTAEEMRELLRQLEQTENPRHCPHGRPTMVHLSADDLAREFRRR
ncbi:MAG: DNA mismatch repair endonuclease MutL [Dehalococcoidia bacterium]|jgi:DNA mismatch repair protein MutL